MENMKETVVICTVLLAITLTTALAACKSKPTGSEYVGTWTGTAVDHMQIKYPCKLEVTKVGESFVLSGKKTACDFATGLYTVTPEGNLIPASGGIGASLTFDRNMKQIILSYPTIELAHLNKAQ